MKLGIDIGCGESQIEMPETRFIRLDIRPEVKPDVVCNVTLLPFDDGVFDVIHSSHVLEHFPRKLWKLVLTEWLRTVKPFGQAWFRLPNIVWAAECIVNEHYINADVLNVLYGAQDNPFDFHYNGLTPEIMQQAMAEQGFYSIHFSQINYNMTLGFEKAPIAGRA